MVSILSNYKVRLKLDGSDSMKNNRTSIVFFITSLGSGGAQRIMSYIANACSANLFDVTVITIKEDDIKVKLSSKIRVINLGFSNVGGLRNLRILLKNYSIHRLLVGIKPDFIVLFSAVPAVYCFLSTLGIGAKVIAAERDNPKSMSKLVFLLCQRVYEKCDKVVFQMPAVKELFNNRVQKKSIIIPNPCFFESNDDQRYDAYDREEIFIAAGRLEEVKRFDILIDAFGILHKVRNSFKLYIYGKGVLQAKLQEKINNMGLNDYIYLKGEKKDFFKDAGKAYAFVLSSESEGVPNVLLEAMARGIPCVSSDCEPGGARFLLKNGELGKIAECNNPSDLARKMLEMIDLKEMCNGYSKTGQQYVKQFDPVEIEKEWLRLFRES